MTTTDMAQMKRTPLYEAHVEAGGKLVDFAGWLLPVHYGSLIEEHHAVRRAAGMFDVSHMTVVDVGGADALRWLRGLLSGDVATLVDGAALYACLCNERGGTLDDLIVYRLDSDRFRVIVNAATRDKDIAWFKSHREGDVTLDVPGNQAMLAVQGPQALDRAQSALADVLPSGLPNGVLASLSRFAAIEQDEAFIARTGYTGEDGVEIVLPASLATSLWDSLLADGVMPCGLGARDTLRLEAGMSLYGQDLDEDHSPVECGLGWAVDLADPERDFIGRDVLTDHKSFGGPTRRIGLVLDGRGVLRAGQSVQYAGREIGTVTSGTFSPTREQSIAMALVTKNFHGSCDVLIRDKPVAAHRSKLPFVRNGLPVADATA